MSTDEELAFLQTMLSGASHCGGKVLPFWFYSFLSNNLKTYIMQAELAAAVVAVGAYFSLQKSSATVR